MSERQRIVEKYIEGFRRGDHDRVLDCLTDDVEWNLLGWQSLKGKDQFAAEIRNDAFDGTPDLTIERMIEDEDLVVALGAGRARLRDGGELEFVFSDVFFFVDSKIRRLDTFQVNLGGGPQAIERQSKPFVGIWGGP